MSSTNKTTHYNLPQFIGSDIPTWLGDFNSAMTAIDSGINAAATSASGAATTAAQAATTAAQALVAANRCPFPVGFGGFFHTNPNTIYSGTTWEQKKDVFILAAGDTYEAGSTGGEAAHTLTEAEMPVHDHIEQLGDYTEPTQLVNTLRRKQDGGTISAGFIRAEYTSGLADYVRTATTGGSQPHNNLPPYFAMPFWVRTA